MTTKMLLPASVRILTLFTIAFAVACQKDVGKAGDQTASAPVVSNNVEVYTTIKYSILPKTTDPLITTALSTHIAYFNTNPIKKHLLYVFLPGTYRDPTQCQATPMKAASLGFHALGLMYDNTVPANPLCRATGDTTCHLRARREVVDGVNRHPSVNVWYSNSLINRLSKLLKYLHNTYPTQGWNEYFIGDNPVWSKIIVAGHSQGGCVAGVIGKFYPVKKVIMLSAADFLNNGMMPNWETYQARNIVYFALTNPADEQVSYANMLKAWTSLGMSQYGAPVNIATTGLPYNHSHTLITTVNPNTTMVDKYHNSTGVDAYIPKDATGKYIYDKAWEYLMIK